MKINGIEYDEVELKALAKAGVLQIATKNDPASTTPTAGPLHGPFPGTSDLQFGALSGPGVRPQMFSAFQRPRSLFRLLTLRKSEYFQERLEIQTGVTGGSGTNATSFCGNPPQAGQLKVCKQNVVFGKWFLKTNLNVVPEMGLLRNRADVPREILNSQPGENPTIPETIYSLTDTRDQLAYELYLLGVEAERGFETVSVTGNTATASASATRGFIKEWNGLDQWVKTGYTDADTSLACAAADSVVVSFNAAITSTAAGGDGRTFEQALSDIAYGLKDRADSVGMYGVQWAIVMRKEQFRAATDVLCYQYFAHRHAVVASSTNNMELSEVNQLRLDMLRRQYLFIDGDEWPVVFSEGIPNPATANNTYNADIYFLPISWQGIPLSVLEYFPMDNPYIQKFTGFSPSPNAQIINNGMYLVTKRDTGNCVEYLFSAQLRFILETPFLAARLDDVQYSYRAPTREALPGTSLYVNGGVTYRS